MRLLILWTLSLGTFAIAAHEFGTTVANGVECQRAIADSEMTKLYGESPARLLGHTERRDRWDECVASR